MKTFVIPIQTDPPYYWTLQNEEYVKIYVENLDEFPGISKFVSLGDEVPILDYSENFWGDLKDDVYTYAYYEYFAKIQEEISIFNSENTLFRKYIKQFFNILSYTKDNHNMDNHTIYEFISYILKLRRGDITIYNIPYFPIGKCGLDPCPRRGGGPRYRIWSCMPLTPNEHEFYTHKQNFRQHTNFHKFHLKYQLTKKILERKILPKPPLNGLDGLNSLKKRLFKKSHKQYYNWKKMLIYFQGNGRFVSKLNREDNLVINGLFIDESVKNTDRYCNSSDTERDVSSDEEI